jgi:predicted RNA-binding Zn ribbon-like protein
MSEPDPRSLKLVGGWPCLDFVNTVSCRNSDRESDVLTSYPNLISWSQHAKILTEDEARRLLREAALHRPDAEITLERAITMREALYHIFSAIIHHRTPSTVDIDKLNTEMSTAMTHIRLKPARPTSSWIRTFEDIRLDKMLWSVIQSATELLTSDKLDRIRECQGKNCGWLFLDNSRNRTRKWCDMKDCGNIVKAQRHYEATHHKHPR